MHTSVLKKEVLEFLKSESNKNFVDATIGEAGHSFSILEKNEPRGKVLGIELTPRIYQRLKKLNKERLIVVNDSYSNLEEIIGKNNFQSVWGVLFDLGLSSWHLEESGKGFSFLRDEPLDMRFNPKDTDLTAAHIVNHFEEQEIKRILKTFGQERFAAAIARDINKEREKKTIQTTFQLIEIVKNSVPPWYRYRKRHFATKTFQALRIAVNDELGNLEKALPQAQRILEKGGRIVVISFHSLEDKIVKKYFKEQAQKGQLQILTKKPITPTKKELISNPRSRSAKLRAAEKL